MLTDFRYIVSNRCVEGISTPYRHNMKVRLFFRCTKFQLKLIILDENMQKTLQNLNVDRETVGLPLYDFDSFLKEDLVDYENSQYISGIYENFYMEFLSNHFISVNNLTVNDWFFYIFRNYCKEDFEDIKKLFENAEIKIQKLFKQNNNLNHYKIETLTDKYAKKS